MKKILFILAGIILSVVFFSKCRKKEDDACVFYSNAYVSKVSGANTTLVNQQIDLTVTYNLTNGCGQLTGLDETSYNNSRTINLQAKYVGCFCTDNILSGQTVYKFKATQVGVYYLNFTRPDKTNLIDTITVN